jgi:hypothetical protein
MYYIITYIIYMYINYNINVTIKSNKMTYEILTCDLHDNYLQKIYLANIFLIIHLYHGIYCFFKIIFK